MPNAEVTEVLYCPLKDSISAHQKRLHRPSWQHDLRGLWGSAGSLSRPTIHSSVAASQRILMWSKAWDTCFLNRFFMLGDIETPGTSFAPAPQTIQKSLSTSAHFQILFPWKVVIAKATIAITTAITTSLCIAGIIVSTGLISSACRTHCLSPTLGSGVGSPANQL